MSGKRKGLIARGRADVDSASHSVAQPSRDALGACHVEGRNDDHGPIVRKPFALKPFLDEVRRLCEATRASEGCSHEPIPELEDVSQGGKKLRDP